jgi:hypothetical protein
MAITGESMNVKAQYVLMDTNIRWTKTEMLGWINSAQREILIFKPNANPSVGNITAVVGSKQSLPVGGIQLLDVTRNMGANGTTAGKVITNQLRSIFDVSMPGWHAITPVASSVGADHYIFDPRFPTTFYLYPPVAAGSTVEAIWSALPTDLTGNDTAIVGSIFNDLYETVILDYVLYRAYSKDAEFANAARSQSHYQAFVAALTGKTQGEAGLAPASSPPRKA